MSKHLNSIISKNNQTANLHIVFVDIEKYSKRRTSSQVSIINAYTKCLKEAIDLTAANYIDFIQKNEINFGTDLIIIPTGDGCAVNFTFNGLHDVHLKFSEILLKLISEQNNASTDCDKFESNGWCNCHDKFNVNIAINEGKGIVYKDANDNYNVAGTVINMAARILDIADRNQILFSEEAFLQIVDLAEDPNFSDKFVRINNVEFKHGVKMAVYVYNPKVDYINGDIPRVLVLKDKFSGLKAQMAQAGMPVNLIPGMSGSDEDQIDPLALTSLVHSLADLMTEINDAPQPIVEPETAEEEKLQKKTRRSKKN